MSNQSDESREPDGKVMALGLTVHRLELEISCGNGYTCQNLAHDVSAISSYHDIH
jgi:hypothetical protein